MAKTQQARDEFEKGLCDDLNTAQALAAIFDLVRESNIAIDKGEFREGNSGLILDVLKHFDGIFAVLNDDDGPKLKQVFDWALAEGREKDISDEVREMVRSAKLSDANIEEKIAEMEAARRARDFKISDAIRAQLTDAGVIVEITKDGVRWHRK